jgi:hypothetical protein
MNRMMIEIGLVISPRLWLAVNLKQNLVVELRKMFNILNIAESALLANAVTQGLFNSNLKDFVMGTRKRRL